MISIKVKITKAQDFKKIKNKQVIIHPKSLKKSLAKRVKSIQKEESKQKVKTVELNSVSKDMGINTEKALYLSQIRSQINDKKSYPKIARRLKHEGDLKLEILIDDNGKILSYKYLKESHSRILNQATDELFKSVKNFGKMPASIKVRPLKVIVPISYKLI